MIRKLKKSKAHQKYPTKSGEEVPGASTIVKYAPQADGLMFWAYKCGLNGEDFNKVRDLAADIGSCAHFLIETYLSGDEADLSDFSPNATNVAQQAFNNFLTFWKDSGFQTIKSELQLVSEKHRFGGTLDLLALDKDGKKTLLDFKVVKSHYPNHTWQISAYRALCNENFPESPVERQAILIIPKEPGDAVEAKWISDVAIEKAFQVFLAQLNVFYAMKSEKSKQ